MTDEPRVTQYLDDEERELAKAIEGKNYKTGPNLLDTGEAERFRSAARATVNEERVKISLRLPKSDLARLKAKALEDGLPYQTLINSILHKAART